jgi:hypothetical protein
MIENLTHEVMIDGQLVDLAKPCDLYRALIGYKLKLATGGAASEIEIQSPLTRRRMKFAPGGSLDTLDTMIAEAKEACDRSLGCAVPQRRKRYAISGRMTRPY